MAKNKEQRFPGIYWFCDKCNYRISDDPSFDDNIGLFKCPICGHINWIDESQIIDEDEE